MSRSCCATSYASRKPSIAAVSHYDQCTAGGLRLIPDEALLEALGQDYQAMLAAKMFYGNTLSFDFIVERLRQLEAEINIIVRS